MTKDIKAIKKILKNLSKLSNTDFINCWTLKEINTNLQQRLELLESRINKEICPECKGRGGYLESFNDGLGQRDVDWVVCPICKGGKYI